VEDRGADAQAVHSLPDIKLVAYPLTCPEVSKTYVIAAAANKANKIEEYNYMSGPELAVHVVANLSS
jgi:hypothetical protein